MEVRGRKTLSKEELLEDELPEFTDDDLEALIPWLYEAIVESLNNEENRKHIKHITKLRKRRETRRKRAKQNRE